jgi:hypothetical protein
LSYVVPQPRRPGTVTASGYLLFLVAALIVTNAVVSATTIGPLTDVLRKAYDQAGVPNPDQLVSFVQGIYVGTIVLYVLFGVGYAVLAPLNLRGKNAARIVTWVLGGLGVCCLGCGTAGAAGGNSFSNGFSQGSAGDGAKIDTAEITRELNDALPPWLAPVQTTITVVGLLALLAVILLLALPASNAYFRRPVDTGIDQFLPPGGVAPNQPYPPYGTQPPSSGPPMP